MLTHLRMDAGSVTEFPDGTLLTLAGMGPRRASLSSQGLLDQGANALLSWGSAAGLHATLGPGRLILPKLVLSASLTQHFVNQQWHRKLYSVLEVNYLPRTEALVESPSVLMNSDQKLALGRRSGAIAADMESAAIAEVAQRANIPFLAIRAVSDSVQHEIPQRLLQATDEIGRMPWQKILTLIVLRPWRWPTAVRLGWGFRTAMGTLRGVVDSVDHGLLFSPPT